MPYITNLWTRQVDMKPTPENPNYRETFVCKFIPPTEVSKGKGKTSKPAGGYPKCPGRYRVVRRYMVDEDGKPSNVVLSVSTI